MTYFLIDLLAMGMITSIMTIGLNMQYGFAGILNFTFYTFVGVGAYVTAVVTMGTPSGYGSESYILHWSLPWPIGLLIAGFVCALLGLAMIMVTIRRLRSDYLAIVTVSIGFIIWNLINNYIPLFDGGNGLFGIPYIAGGANMSNVQYSMMMGLIGLVVLVGALWLSRRIANSPYGRVLRAIREDEVIAESFAKPVRRARISIFMVGCFMAGVSGGLLAYYLTSWNPQGFLPIESFILMAALIIGGTGSNWGAIVGAFVIVELLTEISRYIPTFGSEATVGAVRAILIGLMLILFLMFRPEGIVPERPERWYRTGRVPGSEPSGLVGAIKRREAALWPSRTRQPLA